MSVNFTVAQGGKFQNHTTSDDYGELFTSNSLPFPSQKLKSTGEQWHILSSISPPLAKYA